MDIGYVVQKKVWYGWKNWAMYDWSSSGKQAAIEKGKELKARGHEVAFYI